MRTSVSSAVTFTHRKIGLGVREGTTDVSRLRASARATLSKLAFRSDLEKEKSNVLRKFEAVVYSNKGVSTISFPKKARDRKP